MRRTIVGRGAALLGATLLGATLPGVALLGVALLGVAPLATAATAGSQLQANRRAAHQDVRALLQRVRLPGGLTQIAQAPSWAGSLVGDFGPGSRYASADSDAWETSASPQAIIAYVRAHPPAGAQPHPGTGSGGDAKTGVTSLDVQFSWPDLGRQVWNRTLSVTVATRQGASVVVVRSQAYWVVPRSPAERVPSGAHAVAVTLRIGAGPSGVSHQHSGTRLFTGSARVAAIVGALDRLEIVQPGQVIACPMMFVGGPLLTLDFKTGASGSTLAQAQVRVSPGANGYAGFDSCDPIQFSIAGKQQTALISRTFVKWIGTLIGTRIS